MSKRDFAEDRRICDAATAGPWVRVEYEDAPILSKGTGLEVIRAEGDDMSYLDVKEDDIRFVTAARTGWPAALDEIERLQGKYERCVKHNAVLTARLAGIRAENERYQQALESIAGLTMLMFGSIEDLAKHAKKTAREALVRE